MNRNKHFYFSLIFILSFFVADLSAQKGKTDIKNQGEYITVVEGFDWGAAVSKVILTNDKNIAKVNKDDFTVFAQRETECMELKGDAARTERSVLHAYISDEKGNNTKNGDHITLVLQVGPSIPIANALQYTRNEKCSGNKWVDYTFMIINKSQQQVWNNTKGRIIPLVDNFNTTGSFTADRTTLTYASFKPQVSKGTRSPLIIWLHGGGEGGTDPTIPLLANRAANYAAPEMQKYFGGAYVLVPQTPTRWMHGVSGETTRGKEDDIYNKALMLLIKDYVAKNPGIDPSRIYVGGCSNGGYMSLKLIIKHPEYFAAGFISALAYNAAFISKSEINKIKNVPIWFIHSKDDTVTKPAETVVPLYKMLKAAGAPNVHFSYYDHVVDLYGFFGGKDLHYSGHWSWIYSHVNHCDFDFDGKPVMMDGKAVSLMEWMAAQQKGAQ